MLCIKRSYFYSIYCANEYLSIAKDIGSDRNLFLNILTSVPIFQGVRAGSVVEGLLAHALPIWAVTELGVAGGGSVHDPGNDQSVHQGEGNEEYSVQESNEVPAVDPLLLLKGILVSKDGALGKSPDDVFKKGVHCVQSH